ncbi:MAG: BACON domain-containing protein, partial [Alistipes sp.]|nr:BACON domain-containing protein [Alistipes sp.]
MKPFCSYLLSLGLIAILTLGFGCSSKEEFIPELSVSLENIDNPTTRVVTFGNEGGNISMQIEANAQWEIICPNNWINLSHNKGTGNQSVTIWVAPAKESRSAVLKISLVEYKQESVSIDIIQHYTPDEPKDDDPDNNEGNPSDKPSNPDQGDDGSGGDNPNENPSDKDDPTDPESGDDPNKPNDDGGDNQGGENNDGDGNGNEGDGNEEDGQGGEGGEGIDPDEPKDNPEDQEPQEPTKEPQPISIADLRSLMDEDMQSITIDDEYDRVLTAIVMNDCNANNFYNNHLYLSEEGATSAENGITLSGKLVSPQNLGVNMGDKVQITLKAQNAVAIKYNGRYEVTGEVGSEWMEMEILDSGNEITPIEIMPKDLLSYQAMTVTLKDVEPTSSGHWHSAENEGYTEFISSDGTPFKVYVYTQALFSANEYHATKGDITGIVTVENNEAILCP